MLQEVFALDDVPSKLSEQIKGLSVGWRGLMDADRGV